MQYPPNKTGPTEEIHSIKTMIHQKADMVRYLLPLHGCTIDEEGTQEPECTVIFPEGSTRQELYPRALETRYRILLPDGFELREVDNRQERTQLYLLIDTLPNEEKNMH